MVKSTVVNGPTGDEHRVAISLGVGEHFRVQMAAIHSRLANPDVPHAGNAADRPFFHYRLEPRRGSSHPEINREIIGVEVADGISKADLAVGAIEIKCLSHFAIGEGDTGWRAIVPARQIGGIPVSRPPTNQTGGWRNTLRL